MSNMDSLGRSSTPSGQTNSQTNLAGKGDDETAGQSLFDGLFALMNQPDPDAGPAALSVAQSLPAKAIFMSLSPVDQDNAADADVILLNTCSIREKAQEKVFHQLGRWKHLKEANPELLIGVGGCVASQEGEAIAKRAPFVDVIFGPQTLHRLPEMMETRKTDGTVVVDISFPEIEKLE